MMNVYIVEDEQLAQERLEKMIIDSPFDLDICGRSKTGKTAIKDLNQLQPELIFLDIQLLDMTGLDVLDNLIYSPFIIFTTAYDQYALDALEHFAIAYLVKPITQEGLNRAIKKWISFQRSKPTEEYQKLKQFYSSRKPKRSSFSIKKGDKIILVDINEVVWLIAEDKYVKIGLKNGKKHLLTTTIGKLEDELPDTFIRIHRSYLINKEYVLEIHKYFRGRYIFKLTDQNESEFTSSESYAKVIKKIFDFS